ncbi:hypothetical protein HDU99_001024, partial [Rhizoclosmatium hyalinum]
AIDAHHSDSFNDFISEYADVLDVGMHGTEATCDSDFKDDLNALLGIRNDGHEMHFISGNPVESHFGNSQRLDETMEQNEDEVLGIGSTTFDDISAESSVSYECFSCGGTFAQYDHLANHSCHSSPSASSISLPPSIKPAAPKRPLKAWELEFAPHKKVPCEVCGSMFTSSANKNVHMRSHTGERPFKCKICPATFTVSSHLKKVSNAAITTFSLL